VIKRQEDRLGMPRDCDIEDLGTLAQGPGDEPAADGLVAGGGELALEPGFVVGVAAADEAEAAGSRYGRRQPAACDHVHGGAHDRMGNSEALRQPRRDRHVGSGPLSRQWWATAPRA